VRGIKPFKLGFLTRPFQTGPDHHLGISTMVYFTFGDPAVLHTDVEMWQMVGEQLAGQALDEGIPRAASEFLVVGRCHQPGGQARPSCPVRARVGDVEKVLYVVGDRHWENGVPTAPEPFTSMPLTWAHAFGGAGFDRNPLGKGYEPVEVDGEPFHPLPNLELPGAMIDSPHDRPEPASLGPIDFTWPQRFGKLGTYDQRWLETRFPGFADDLQWGAWNLASPDQQRNDPWRGDEEILLENLHPDRPHIEARLPGLRSRAFITRAGAEEGRLLEVPLGCRAVWLFPELEQGILVFQGAVRVLEDDARDIASLMVAAELLDEPRPYAHYVDVQRRRSGADAKDDPTVHLRDEDLVPELAVGFTPGIEADMALLNPQGHRAERMQKRQELAIEEARAQIAAAGLDPDLHGPAPPEPLPEAPEMSDVPELIASMAKTLQEEKARAEERTEAGLQYVRELYAEHGLDPHMVDEELKTAVRGPPQLSAARLNQMLEEARETAEQHGVAVDEIVFYENDEATQANLRQMEAEQLQMYRRSAHFQQPAFTMTPEYAARVREEIELAAARGESLRGRDLTGLVIEDARLAGADLTEALMESAHLPRGDLRGADLTDACIAHAHLVETDLSGAVLRGTNFGKARLERVNFDGARFVDGLAYETVFEGCSLKDAWFTNGTCLQSDLSGSDLMGARFDKTRFVECRFEGTRFAGGAFPDVVFFKADLRGADFRGANLDGVTFFDCQLEGANLAGATLRTARCFGEGVGSWKEVDLRGADLTQANLRGLDLRGARFDGATMNKADLSEADCRGASFYRVVAKESLFIRTNLEGGSLVSADLMMAMLSKADLRSADFRGANLYAADLALIRADEATRVQDAIQLKVRAVPRYVEPRPLQDPEPPT
jgi:uncharacterized protein YjbI with pentapeptide repeats